MLLLTFGVLDLLETLAQSRAVFELDALFIRGDGLVPVVSSVEGGTLACITLGPLRVYPDALAARSAYVQVVWIEDVPPQRPAAPRPTPAFLRGLHSCSNRGRGSRDRA